MKKKELTKTEEKDLYFIGNIRKLLNQIDKGKYHNNPHIKEIWLRLDMLENDIKKSD